MVGRRPRDRGAAAVEAALMIPLVAMLIFGIVDFGRLMNAQITISAAAREGARASAVGGDAGDRIDEIMDTTYTVPSPALCGSNPTAEDDARITVKAPFEFVTPFSVLSGLVFDGELTATGVTPCRV